MPRIFGLVHPSLEGLTAPNYPPPLARNGGEETHPADPTTGAMREKLNHVPYDLVPIELIEATAEGLEYGAGKYAPNNWRKGYPVMQVCGSIVRHCFALMKGEVTDPPSGQPHVNLICANAAFLATYSKSGPWNYAPRDKMVDVKPKAKKLLYYLCEVPGVRFEGPNRHMSGDCSRIWGDCTNVSGDCSGLTGNCAGLKINATTLRADVSELVDERGNKLGK